MLDAHGPPLHLALESRPWLVKVNREEAREATGISIAHPAQAHAAAAEIRKLGAMNAVVTLGATGGVIASEHGAWTLRQQAPPGPFAVGAGDTMLGAIGVRLAQGSSLQEAARYGTAAAAANALTPGAAQFKAAETDRLLPRISLEPA
jgi:fructose-1-phosphate kinase PfkB-like protein